MFIFFSHKTGIITKVFKLFFCLVIGWSFAPKEHHRLLIITVTATATSQSGSNTSDVTDDDAGENSDDSARKSETCVDTIKPREEAEGIFKYSLRAFSGITQKSAWLFAYRFYRHGMCWFCMSDIK